MMRSTDVSRSIPVLLYHRIAASPEERFAVSPELFARHVQVILDSGRVPMTIDEVASGIRGELRLPARPVGITFDDGFADTVGAAAFLADRGLRCNVYVTTGRLDGAGLSTQELRELGGMEGAVVVGAHTVSHPRLDELSLAHMRQEIAGSKEVLEGLLGRSVTTFAYPHGMYDPRVRRAVIEAGFSSAAAVKNALSHDCDDPWAVARYTVTEATTPSRLTTLLDGGGAPDAWQHARLRTRAFRVVRRARMAAIGKPVR